MPRETPFLSNLPRDLGKALVVDDEPVIRSLYAEVLQAMGFTVETAADGVEGVERLKESGYNLIISDIRMPRMTGIEFLLKSGSVRPGSQHRFIFTTGLLDSLNAHEYMIATERPCIMKPARVDNIQQTILEFLRSHGAGTS
ncbi:MAG TPA: response regulator [Candidatus Polarisedimenticolia bacterium]|jgi:CheY-like chemotaxis protein|nr:response regulator [Candidatus Polarisedimenticolia bacterium]